MAQFDLHRLRGKRSGPKFVLDVQSDLLERLTTRLVVPVYALRRGDKPVEILEPVFEHDGRRFILQTAELAAIARTELGPTVGSLAERRGDIVAAIDLLITGI